VQEADEAQNLNRYTYVLNNPQAYVDPNGHFWWIITAVVSVIAVAAETIWPGLLIALEGGGLTTLGSLVATTIISSAQMGMLSSELQNQAELRPIASKQQSNIQQALRTNESQPGIDSPGSDRPSDKGSWWERIADRIGGCRPGDDVCSMGGPPVLITEFMLFGRNPFWLRVPRTPPEELMRIPKSYTDPPGPGWERRGKGPIGSEEEAWYNPKTGESLHPNPFHPPPIPPHWDYIDPGGMKWRVFPDGQVLPVI
jgi:hypothetical protein